MTEVAKSDSTDPEAKQRSSDKRSGRLKIITHNKATTTGTAAISFEIGGVAVTGGAISHVASGSAGKVATAAPTALNTVAEDGTIECITNGGSSNASKMEITFVIRR